MKTSFRTRRTSTAWQVAMAAALLLGCVRACLAGDYPNRPIRLISPYAAGGAVDMVGRALAKELTLQMKTSFVMMDEGGAGGVIAAKQVARAKPDGYTVFLGATGPLMIAPVVYKDVGFDPLKDFAPVSLIATTPYVLAITNSLPANSVADLIKLARQKHGQLNFASSGTGGPDHLAGELFKQMSGIEVTHVPYKGSGPALTDLMAGRVQFEFVSPLPSMPLANAKKIRIIAVTSAHRSVGMPDLPTVAETGLPGFDVSPWYGLLLPRGTPPAIVERLNKELAIALHKKSLRDLLIKAGLDPQTDSPEQFATFLAADARKWRTLVESAHLAHTGDVGQ